MMDRQARKLTAVREDGSFGEENYPEPGSDEEEKEVTTEHTIVIGGWWWVIITYLGV